MGDFLEEYVDKLGKLKINLVVKESTLHKFRDLNNMDKQVQDHNINIRTHLIFKDFILVLEILLTRNL